MTNTLLAFICWAGVILVSLLVLCFIVFQVVCIISAIQDLKERRRFKRYEK